LLRACLSPKKYVTKILPDSLTKTTDTSPVYFTHNLFGLDTIRETSEVREAGSSVSLPNYHRKSSSQITKISRFTSINDRTTLASIDRLLVNNLLLSGTNPINCDRSDSMGLYQSVYVKRSYPVREALPKGRESPSIRQKRAISLYWCLLPKLGSSNLPEQTLALQQVLPLFKEYKVIVLGDREFCSVDLGNWPGTMGVSFGLRLKKNQCLETENLIWQRLDQLGVMLWNCFVLSRSKGQKNPTISRI